jgi:hypothetical protein
MDISTKLLTKMNKLNIREMQPQHQFSELSHYTLKAKGKGKLTFIHHASGSEVTLSEKYVTTYLKNAEQYQDTIKVGREDKFWTAKQIEAAIKKREFRRKDAPEVGDLRVQGIRSLWESIHSQQVFSVGYLTNSKETSHELKERREEKIADIIADLGPLRSNANKASRESYVKEALMEALQNPVVKAPNTRVLRGYKVQFTSRDGRYNCVDMDLDAPNNVRPVNINTLQWLVFDGVKYIVE